jgi:anti-sigma regulatory factor (Ser/Thr protein kinase)
MEQVTLTLPSRYSEYERLQAFVASFTDCRRYSQAFVDGVQLCIKEAFVNAIKHGNGEQEALSVTCSLMMDEGRLRVSIRDCGQGFNLDALSNPCEKEHLQKLSGRGIAIIRSLTEIVTLEHDGNGSTLTMRYIPF